MIKLALQLYTVRNELEADLEGTLAAISKIGYSGVEFCGNYYGLEATEMKELLDKYNLKAVSSHIKYRYLKEDFCDHIRYLKTLGANHITIPALPKEAKEDEIELLRIAASLDNMAKRVKRKGLSLSFHNHR